MARRTLDLRGAVVPLAAIGLAEVSSRAVRLESDSLASPWQIGCAGWEALRDGTLAGATVETLVCALAGLAIGFSVGMLLGSLFGLLGWVDRMMEVTVELIRPLPAVALIPIMLLVFGFGHRMEIATVAFATTWPTMILTRAAVAEVEPRLMEVSRLLGLSLRARLVAIVIPAALPRIVVALRLSVGIALMVAVTVEIGSNTQGLGYAMMNAVQSLNPALMLALLVWTGLLGWGLNMAMQVAEARLLRARGVEADPR